MQVFVNIRIYLFISVFCLHVYSVFDVIYIMFVFVHVFFVCGFLSLYLPFTPVFLMQPALYKDSFNVVMWPSL